VNDPADYYDPDGRQVAAWSCTPLGISDEGFFVTMPFPYETCTAIVDPFAWLGGGPGWNPAKPRGCRAEGVTIPSYSLLPRVSELGVEESQWTALSLKEEASFLNIVAVFRYLQLDMGDTQVYFGGQTSYDRKAVTQERVFFYGIAVAD
jgi:hypothetical protein